MSVWSHGIDPAQALGITWRQKAGKSLDAASPVFLCAWNIWGALNYPGNVGFSQVHACFCSPAAASHRWGETLWDIFPSLFPPPKIILGSESQLDFCLFQNLLGKPSICFSWLETLLGEGAAQSTFGTSAACSLLTISWDHGIIMARAEKLALLSSNIIPTSIISSINISFHAKIKSRKFWFIILTLKLLFLPLRFWKLRLTFNCWELSLLLCCSETGSPGCLD